MDQKNQLANKTFSGILYLIFSSIIQVTLKIGVLAILARIISPKEFGLMGIAVIIIEFSKLFSQMGVGPAIVQRKELEVRHLTTGFTLSLLIGLFFAALLTLVAPLLESIFKMEGLTPVLRTISVVFFIDSITIVGQAQLQRNMKFKVIATGEVLSYAIGYGAVGILLGYLGWGVWALVVANICQAFLNFVYIMIVQPFSKRPGFNKDAFKELLHYGGGFTIAKIGNFLALQGDNLVIGRTMGASALGMYGRAYQFMAMPAGLFGNALDKVLFPAMSKVQDDKQRLSKAYLTGTGIIGIVAIPISVIFVLLAPEIIMILLGPKWIEVTMPFRILAASLLFRMSYKMSDSLARGTGAVYKRAWRQLIYAAAVIIFSYIGHFWGLSGVAIGVSISLVLNFFMMADLSKHLTGISWMDLFKTHQQGVQIGAITAIVSYVIISICKKYSESDILIASVTIFAVGVVLFLGVWKFPAFFISDEQKKLINKLVLKRAKKLPVQTPEPISDLAA